MSSISFERLTIALTGKATMTLLDVFINDEVWRLKIRLLKNISFEPPYLSCNRATILYKMTLSSPKDFCIITYF